MNISDLSSLTLKSLQKKYGGVSKGGLWSTEIDVLASKPVKVSVDRTSSLPLVSIFWDGLLVCLYDEFYIPPTTSPTRVRWFIRYIEAMDPKLKELIPVLYAMADCHEQAFKLTVRGT